MTRPLRTLTLVCLLLAGCSGAMDAIKSTFGQQPTASVEGVRFDGIDLESVGLEFDVEVVNPYSFAIPLVDLDYTLSTYTEPFLSGSMTPVGSVPAEGTRSIRVPVQVGIRGLLETVSGLRPGQVIPWDAELGLTIDVPGTGPLRLPMAKSGELPVPAAPRVTVNAFDWEQVSLTTISGAMRLNVENPNSFAFTLRSIDYGLSLEGRDIVTGKSTNSVWMNGEQSTELVLPVSFAPVDAGAALLGIFSSTQVDYALTGALALDTPYGALDVPLAASGRAQQSQ